MADYDRKPDTSIIGSAAADDDTDLIAQLVQTTEAAGGNAGDTAPLECDDLDIVFEREEARDTRH